MTTGGTPSSDATDVAWPSTCFSELWSIVMLTCDRVRRLTWFFLEKKNVGRRDDVTRETECDTRISRYSGTQAGGFVLAGMVIVLAGMIDMLQARHPDTPPKGNPASMVSV
jgi:hypothetical protein